MAKRNISVTIDSQIYEHWQRRAKAKKISFSQAVELALYETSNYKLEWNSLFGWTLRPQEWTQDERPPHPNK